MEFIKLPPPVISSKPSPGRLSNTSGNKLGNGYKHQLNKALLPTPSVFYQRFNLELKGVGDWRLAKCPFHDDKHASLSVNVKHGGYCCHACGAKGDMLKFYQTFHHVDFKTACQDLGLFEEVRK
jgi:hypothetical protein